MDDSMAGLAGYNDYVKEDKLLTKLEQKYPQQKQEARVTEEEYVKSKLKKIPSEDELGGMKFKDLYSLRQEYKDYPEEQKKLAPFEHRAYSREIVQEHPELAIGFSAAIPGYQAAKRVGIDVSTTEQKATPPNNKQAIEAFKGVGEGLGEYMTTEFMKFVGFDIKETDYMNDK